MSGEINIENLTSNAIKFFQNKYPGTLLRHQPAPITVKSNQIGKYESIDTTFLLVFDDDSGVLHRVLITSNSGFISVLSKDKDSYNLIANAFTEINNNLLIEIKESVDSLQSIDNFQVNFSAKIFIYSRLDTNLRKEIMKNSLTKIEIENEAEMYHSVFISYGGPDEKTASILNDYLKKRGVKTFFFPEDKPGGVRLHRMMSDKINEFDKILFLFSKNSLNRNGVQNEIEEALAAQTNKGGKEIILPVCLDNYLFNGWVPPRADLRRQLTSYVCLDLKKSKKVTQEEKLEKILSSLKK